MHLARYGSIPTLFESGAATRPPAGTELGSSSRTMKGPSGAPATKAWNPSFFCEMICSSFYVASQLGRRPPPAQSVLQDAPGLVRR